MSEKWSQLQVPAKFQKLYEQSRAGRSKAAIRCHCLMCMGWEAKEVELCQATACPLFTLRSRAAQAATEAPDRAKRRERALASGRRPPRRAATDGRGAQPQGPKSNATEPVGPATPPDPILRPETGFGVVVSGG